MVEATFAKQADLYCYGTVNNLKESLLENQN
jgi:hypothetical protein